MKLKEIIKIVHVSIERDGEFESLGLVTYATSSMLAFLENEIYLPRFLQNPYITCVITNKDLVAGLPEKYGIAISDYPRKAFYELHNYLATKTNFYWTDFDSEISNEAIIYPNTYIPPKNVRIGRGTIIEPGATILERSIIDEDVIIRAGCTIGTQGFEFKRIEGSVLSVSHAGSVRICNRVEIQANCAISRPIFGGFTEIGEDTKLDNLVHIAHNVRVGKRCFIAACAMIAGSVTIGDDVWIGPGSSISSEVNIGEHAQITIGSVVTKDVKSGQRVTGNFAIEHCRFITFLKSIR